MLSAIKRHILLSTGLIILLIFISGCTQEIVCEKPYMRFGEGCCLDVNDNRVCDTDEGTTTTIINTIPTTIIITTSSVPTTQRVSNKMVFQKIDIMDPLSGAIIIKNIGTYEINSDDLALFVNDILQNCSWDIPSVEPGYNITADCTCNDGQDILVKAPGNSDMEFCYTE